MPTNIMAKNDHVSEISKEDEPFGLGCALESFSESDEALKLIDNIRYVVNEELSVIERASERFRFILTQYIEQPHLIDINLDEILERFFNIVRDPNNKVDVKHLAFKYMFVVVNVRGYKVIVNRLPHEVADLEPVLQLLEAQNPDDTETWTTRYILLLWMSIIVMIPFHMSRLDGFNDSASKKSVMSRIMDIIKIYIIVSDKCRDAAAYLSARFVTRCDVKEEHLSSYLEWCISISLSENSNIHVKYGALASVAMILKQGKRKDLLPFAQNLLQWATDPELKTNTGCNVQKLVYKVVQRIGLTCLPPRLASWRYTRGSRSLAANLSSGDGTQPSTAPCQSSEETENTEVPDEVEEVIDQLIQGLGNSDGIVRWSAAKGIGRVTGRLPKELADEVVASILELFNPREGDSSWHGACLALAELGRRGLLLPSRLPEVVPVVLKALVYDEPRGYSSVGSHIRDAACFVCWSFARAYETEVLKPFVNQIASGLLVVTCFDREINCRRAASAAFQENVGRQGTFPHGIEILTTADFFTVSVRNNSYLNISVYIAQFPEYTIPLIQHLVSRKVDHWDSAIRELTAKALHNLTPRATTYMIEKVLPSLFDKAVCIDLNSRHGSVLAIGHILYALSELSKTNDETPKPILDKNYIHLARDLIPTLRNKLYFRGMGGELMRQACCDFIEKCSLASLPFHEDQIIDDWLSLLDEGVAFDVPVIRSSALAALPAFFNEYLAAENKAARRETIVNKYLAELLSTSTQVNRMGHALALGALPKFMLKPQVDTILKSLVDSTMITLPTVKWAESRRDSVRALTNIINTLSNDICTVLTEQHINIILNTFLEGLKDYTQDKRGDVGAWMREASMTGLQVVCLLLTNKQRDLLQRDVVTRILSNIAKQAVEKIDRTRALAAKIFYSFLYHDPSVPHIPHYEHLTKIFPKEECDELNWNSASATFPKFVQLIQFPEFTYDLMVGMICSIGGLTESLVKNSSSSLFLYLSKEEKTKGYDEINRLCQIIYQIFEDYQKDDRIIVPMLRFLDKIIDSGCINIIIHDLQSDFLKKILKLVQSELQACRDIYKLIDGINVLCQFIQVKSEVCNSALVQLSILLCHRQTYVRKSTSTRLYESLIVNGDNSNIKIENLDEILQILGNTNWEEPVDQIKPIRNSLCHLMGIRVPVPKSKT